MMSCDGGFVMAKSELKIAAKKLRSDGESIKKIAKKLLVSPSTVSLWCKDIVLSSDQIKELERRAHDPNYGKRLENSIKQRTIRLEKTERLLKEGIRDIGKLTKRELFLTGTALYWTEGFKCDNLAGFCNSDPNMVKLFIRWLKECFDYQNENLRLRVGINESYLKKTKELETFWSNLTEIPISQFQKPYYQKVKWQKTFEHPEEYHGVLRIRVKKSTDFLRKIKGYIEGLKLNV